MDGTVHTVTEDCKRAALYLRISKLPKGKRSALRDESGTSYSIEDQDVRCEELCEREGYTIVERFYDDGISAYRSLKDRPGYGDMKAALVAGAFDVLVFDRQDRLARDESETMRFIADCRDAKIIWHSARESEGKVDTSERLQRLLAILRGGDAEQYSASISANQKAGNARKRDLGLPGAGPRPFGFEDDKITLRESEAALIRKGTEMILDGAPRYQVMKMFRDSGIKTTNGREWHSAKVTKILSRWRNAGWTEYNDVPHTKAVWPEIVSKDDVTNARAILSRGRAPGRWKKPTMLCSGIARCPCGYQMVSTGSTVGPSYRCGEIIAKAEDKRSPGPHVSITATIMDEKVREALLDAYMTRPVSSVAGKAEADKLARLYKRRDETEVERGKIQRGWEANIYNDAEAAAKIAAVESELVKIAAEIDAAAAESAHAAMLAEVHASLWANVEPGGIQDNFLRAMQRDYGISREEAINRAVGSVWAELPREHLTDEEADGMRPEHVAEYNGNIDRQPEVSPVYTNIREALAGTFDGMDLEARRDLVRAMLSIKVLPVGKGCVGSDRVVVTPLDRLT